MNSAHSAYSPLNVGMEKGDSNETGLENTTDYALAPFFHQATKTAKLVER